MPLTKTRYHDDFTSFIKEVKSRKEEENFFLYGHCSDPDCPFEEVIGYQYFHQVEDADAELEDLFKRDHYPDCNGKLVTGQEPYTNEEIDTRMRARYSA